jgi:AcrR family transcriptional regulator
MADERRRGRESVADRLIRQGELLYGQRGIEGVSLRQICEAAGSGNNYAVQYHFGSADGLIQAIHSKHVQANELRRADLFAQAKAEGRLSVHDLIRLLYLPIIENKDENGERTYARFLLALHSSPNGVHHTIDLLGILPVAREIMSVLQKDSLVGRAMLSERNRLVTLMILSSLFNRRPPFDDASRDQACIENAFDMAVVMLTAGDRLCQI